MDHYWFPVEVDAVAWKRAAVSLPEPSHVSAVLRIWLNIADALDVALDAGYGGA